MGARAWRHHALSFKDITVVSVMHSWGIILLYSLATLQPYSWSNHGAFSLNCVVLRHWSLVGTIAERLTSIIVLQHCRRTGAITECLLFIYFKNLRTWRSRWSFISLASFDKRQQASPFDACISCTLRLAFLFPCHFSRYSAVPVLLLDY